MSAIGGRLRTHLTSTQWAEATRALGALVQFVVVARALGPDSYGSLAVLMFLISIAYALLPGPLGMSATRRTAAGEQPYGVITSTFLRLLPVSALGVIALLVVCEFTLRGVPPLAVAGIAISELLVVGVIHVCSSVSQGTLEFHIYLRIIAASTAARVIAAVLFLVALPHTITAWAVCCLVVTGVASAVVAGATLVAFRHHPAAPATDPPRGERWVFALNAVAVRVLDDADKAILAWTYSYTAAGVYTAGYRVASYVLVPARGILARSMPQMFALGAEHESDALWDLLHQTRKQLLVVCGLSLPILVLGAFALPWVMGPAYADSTPVALLLIPALALRGYHFALGDMLTAVGQVRTRLAGQLVSVIVPCAAYLLLIPRYGMAGAVIATALGEAATLTVMYRMARRTVGHHVKATVDA